VIGVVLVAAHQDTIIHFEDGTLRGLPKEFQPATFDVDKKILTISGKVLQFPDSLKALFPDDRPVDRLGDTTPVRGIPYELQFSASWYHGPSLLPPYLQITITPKNRDFHSEILIDIESLAFLKAHVFLKISETRTDAIPVLIVQPKTAKRGPDDWLSIIGKWSAHPLIVEITKNQLTATLSGVELEYPKGTIRPIKPGLMSLKLPSGVEENFIYERKGDILELGFLRAPGIGLARLGSPADEAYQRRNQPVEQGGADQPATKPTDKPPVKDQPSTPTSKDAPR
jgi:hypothetical protein